MALSLTSSGVSISKGRGKLKVSVEVSFSDLDAWSKRMKVNIPKLQERSFAAACSGLKRKFLSVILSGGGRCGVPKFRDWEEFTKSLRQVEHSNKPLGGKLADRNSIGAWKRNGWQIIGWKDYLERYAKAFQDAISNDAEARLNDNGWRYYLHRRGIKEIPRTYVKNPRQVIPEPFGSFVKQNLEEWARGAYYKQLARMMSKSKA